VYFSQDDYVTFQAPKNITTFTKKFLQMESEHSWRDESLLWQIFIKVSISHSYLENM